MHPTVYFYLQDNTLKSLAVTAADFQVTVDISLLAQVGILNQGRRFSDTNTVPFPRDI